MDIIAIIAGLIVVSIVGYIIYDKRKTGMKIEKVIVTYSEKVGNIIVEDDEQYIGLIDYEKDIFKVPKKNIRKPIPEAKLFVPTRMGKKKLYMIKIDSFRYGFRVPNTHNQVYIQKRDDYGNLIKTKEGKPYLTKYKWYYCDDVVEPDVKHWEENVMEKIRQKHRTRADMLSKWIAPIAMALILITGIVVIQQTTKFVMASIDKQVTLAEGVEAQAKQNTGLINNLIKRIDQKEGAG